MKSVLMEALQMLKFHLKKTRLDFTAGWKTLEEQLVDDIPKEDLLGKLSKGGDMEEIIQLINEE